MKDCPLCDYPEEVLFEDELVFVRMKKSIRVRGHVQVIPKQHIVNVWEMDAVAEFFDRVAKTAARLASKGRVAMVATGSNQHFHLNLIPVESGATLEELMQKEIILDDSEHRTECERVKKLVS